MQVQTHRLTCLHGGEETQEEKARHFHTYLHGGEETDEARNPRVLGTWFSFPKEWFSFFREAYIPQPSSSFRLRVRILGSGRSV